MFRNYLAAALRNLARNRLYAAINIVGLSIGFATALLIGLFVRHETTFDHFIPGFENIYKLSHGMRLPGNEEPPTEDQSTWMPMQLKLNVPGIEVARLSSVYQ